MAAATTPEEALSVRLIEVVGVDRAQLASLVARDGFNWPELRAEAEKDESPLVLRIVQFGGVNQLQSGGGWVPPTDRNGNELAYLPRDKAWLRDIDGRANLYRQNW